MSDVLAFFIRLGLTALVTGFGLLFLGWVVSVVWPIFAVLLVLAIVGSLVQYAERVEEARARRTVPKHWWHR